MVTAKMVGPEGGPRSDFEAITPWSPEHEMASKQLATLNNTGGLRFANPAYERFWSTSDPIRSMKARCCGPCCCERNVTTSIVEVLPPEARFGS